MPGIQHHSDQQEMNCSPQKFQKIVIDAALGINVSSKGLLQVPSPAEGGLVSTRVRALLVSTHDYGTSSSGKAMRFHRCRVPRSKYGQTLKLLP